MRNFFLGLLLCLLLALPAVAESLLERGTYLVRTIVACGNCHTPQTLDGPVPGREMAGRLVIDKAAFTAYAPNITQDRETGIGGWSDAQIAAAIRDGVRPDGSIIGPPMPFPMYRQISDHDVMAIIAYLRTVAPITNTVAKSEYRVPLPKSRGPAVSGVADPPRNDEIAYGAYLTGPLGHCMECHTPLVKGIPDLANRAGAGGNIIPEWWGTAVSANISPHAEDGIAGYSDGQIKTIVTTGVRPDGSRLTRPMGFSYYRDLTAADLDAIVAYLRTLDPVPFPD